jgi:hypothetical protein
MKRPEPDDAEQHARESIERQAGRPLTDEEWQEAADNLRQLILLLASWEESAHVVVENKYHENDHQ